jgi:hypothetical protein
VALASSPAGEELTLGMKNSAVADERLREYIKQRVAPGSGQ